MHAALHMNDWDLVDLDLAVSDLTNRPKGETTEVFATGGNDASYGYRIMKCTVMNDDYHDMHTPKCEELWVGDESWCMSELENSSSSE